jgi:glycosyltransferase involved in cell wall biosynthesis
VNIVVIGPSPYPFTIGGMEYLQMGLVKSFNQITNHNCELIKIITKENTFWDLIESYKNFYHLDLGHFDMVISTKYPSWMVRHDNHICYMAHKLRGLYDAYHFNNMPLDFRADEKPIKDLLDYMEKNKDVKDLDTFFTMLKDIKESEDSLPRDYFSFPHPFIRKIVRYMDDFALSVKNIRRYYAISDLVKNRKDYFPIDSYVKVLYPPTFSDAYKVGKYDYLLTLSRLDGPKRIDLLVNAMKHVDSDIPLYIAGSGPQEKHLRALAKRDKRVHFLGFKSSKEIIDLYADALAVLFVPYQEDYGLVAIEAMKSAKPVITCKDSGGPTELIENNVNGFVLEPKPRAIAEKIDFLAKNKAVAEKIGRKAHESIKNISWEYVVKSLLEDKIKESDRKKIDQKKQRPADIENMVIATSAPIYPPRGGGQVRLFNLFKFVAKKCEVKVISYGLGKKILGKEISDNFYETIIPRTIEHLRGEQRYHELIGVPASDAALPLLDKLTPEYEDVLKNELSKSDVAILSHPYHINQIERLCKDQLVVYEAQDVEYILKKKAYPRNNEETKKILKLIYETEKKACTISDITMVCSDEDKNSLVDLYKVPEDKFLVVPNGVDCEEITFVSQQKRQEFKKILGLEDNFIIIFIGSWHPPNVDAVRVVKDLAYALPDIKFLIIGSICSALDQEKLPDNLGLMGVISEAEKKMVYNIADVALNPMTFGSGTNIKMMDYMASGIPIITTEIGKRGLGLTDNVHLIVSDIKEFKEKITAIYSKNIHTERFIENAYKLAKNQYDWKIIAANLMDHMNEKHRQKNRKS